MNFPLVVKPDYELIQELEIRIYYRWAIHDVRRLQPKLHIGGKAAVLCQGDIIQELY